MISSILGPLLHAGYYVTVAGLFPTMWLTHGEQALLSFSLSLLLYHSLFQLILVFVFGVGLIREVGIILIM